MRKVVITLILFIIGVFSFANGEQEIFPLEMIKHEVLRCMDEGGIPGVSIVLVKDGKQIIQSYGYKAVGGDELIESTTLFELGSCSNAFSALAILKLEAQGKVNLNNKVSDYLPWFKSYYKGNQMKITLNHLLHHTSGIPWNTISKIPASNDQNALKQTVEAINGTKLCQMPGLRYEYAAINYAILALVLESVTGEDFESFIKKEIFDELGLTHSQIGHLEKNTQMSKGHKIGFFNPRIYNSPVYKGNNASGYVISDATDMAKWLKYQLGLIPTSLDTLITKSHRRDDSVQPFDLLSYAGGWLVSLRGDHNIHHSGLNPNFASYIGFNKGKKVGVVVLANSNSNYVTVIGENIMDLSLGKKVQHRIVEDVSNDKSYSIVSIILGIYLLASFAFILYTLVNIIKKKRNFVIPSLKNICQTFALFLLIIPISFGIYLLPKVMFGFSWKAILVWNPVSFKVMVVLIVTSIITTYFAYVVSLLFPDNNQYRRSIPSILLFSIFAGLSNMALIILITSSLGNPMEFKFLMFYFSLLILSYLGSRKYVQTRMIHLSRNLVYDLRMRLLSKVFATTYENFEKVDRGRIYTTMNEDIGTIGSSSNIFVGVSTSIITTGGAFLYLATMAFWATLISVLLIGIIATVYYFVSRNTQVLFEEARESRTVYMRLLNGLVDGFKELSLHLRKKVEYQSDIELSTDEYRRKISRAEVKFVNAFLVGESLLILVLAVVSFIVPKIFADISLYTLMSFIVLLLYLIGPINNILGAVPAIMQFRIAWGRVNSFINDIPSTLSISDASVNENLVGKTIDSLLVKGVVYSYANNLENGGFSVGPIDLELKKGEALFIVGGNGSGKTTLAKLLTGLYPAHKGEIFIDDRKVDGNEIGENYSTVFSPSHLFPKMYNVDTNSKKEYLKDLLKVLQLQDKVNLIGNEYSTTNLSGGQRTRLSLLQCYLEDKPIYLFDELAADQDPEYRKFFYRELITKMKNEGKIIIAITHDDHYFDVADKVLKMDNGKVEYMKGNSEISKSTVSAISQNLMVE